MNTTLEVFLAFCPIIILVCGFLVLRLDALRATCIAMLFQIGVVLFVYHMPVLRIVESWLWGNLVVWAGFLVLYTGQIFGRSYRSTGLLEIMLDAVGALVPPQDTKARSLALVTVMGGMIGAFNGWSAYPVCILGLVELGFGKVQSVCAYLVFTSWFLPIASLFITDTIANAVTHLPQVEIAQALGLMLAPIVPVSLYGFLRILKFPFFERDTQILFWSLTLANVGSIVVFTQFFPNFYLLTMIVGALLSLAVVYVYGAVHKHHAAADGILVPRSLSAAAAPLSQAKPVSLKDALRAFAPLLVCVGFVILLQVPEIKEAMESMRFSITAWGYGTVRVSIVTSAGFMIFVTALACYPFGTKKCNPLTDIWNATKHARTSLATLVIGSGLVYLMLDAGQIDLLARVFTSAGVKVYAAFNPALSFFGGMAFGQGVPAQMMLSKLQQPIAATFGISAVVLVAAVANLTHSAANPLKPTIIRMCASLVEQKGTDPEIFRINLPWALAQALVTGVVCYILVFTWS